MATRFCVIRAGDSRTDEFTNIGMILFDGNGNYHSHKIAKLDRAIRRGDWPEGQDGEWLHEHVKRVKDLATLEKIQNSTSHIMSTVQFGRLGSSILSPEETLDTVWSRLVKE